MSDELALITPATQNKYLYFFFISHSNYLRWAPPSLKMSTRITTRSYILPLYFSSGHYNNIIIIESRSLVRYIHIIYTVCVFHVHGPVTFFRTHARSGFFFSFSFLNVQQTGWPFQYIVFLIFRHINICCAYNDGLICFLLSSRICKCLVCLVFFLSG